MKIISYSDLHLEFGHDWRMPADIDADILILAGDIICFCDFTPLVPFLRHWRKPVLFVAGNHEYYHAEIGAHSAAFTEWLKTYLPQTHFLNNEAVTINGVHFFGGTMWTDFASGSERPMQYAEQHMIDFKLIREREAQFTPECSVKLHDKFKADLEQWFDSVSEGPCVVVTHHAPVADPKTKHAGSPLQPAFVCTDLYPLIEKFHPDVWIYGHTHECGAHTVGKTRLISNQLGYLRTRGGYGCRDWFDPYGCLVNLEIIR